MACNPALCAGSDGVALPAPFAGEQMLLSRDGIEFELDGLECVHAQHMLAPSRRVGLTRDASCRRCGLGLRGKTLFAPARLYLSTVRLVLVCKSASTALRAFDAPLVRPASSSP